LLIAAETSKINVSIKILIQTVLNHNYGFTISYIKDINNKHSNTINITNSLSAKKTASPLSTLEFILMAYNFKYEAI